MAAKGKNGSNTAEQVNVVALPASITDEIMATIPVSAFGRKGVVGSTSADHGYIDGIKAPQGPEGPYHSRTWAVEVPATITNAEERVSASKERAKKLSGRLSQIARRISDNDNTKHYITRSKIGVDGVTVVGVSVIRVNESNIEPRAPRKPRAKKADVADAASAAVSMT